MKRYLYSIMEKGGTLTIEEMISHILVSVILGALIYLSYYITHAGTVYSKKFNVSLITLTILTATVMTVIGNNIALSLGMVGALSIVRFRTAIKDSRDATYIFWTIIVGISLRRRRLYGGGYRKFHGISCDSDFGKSPQ